MPGQFGQDEFQVRRDGLGTGFFFEIIRADEQNHRWRVQREHVFLQADENAP